MAGDVSKITGRNAYEYAALASEEGRPKRRRRLSPKRLSRLSSLNPGETRDSRDRETNKWSSSARPSASQKIYVYDA